MEKQIQEIRMTKPILITLTAPTCSGKSYLLTYIRDTAKRPCLTSTTTRPPREGEVDGLDYIFISNEESKSIEASGGFAELAIFRGHRYGVTKQEFKKKLEMGPAFLIVEPTGIDHYVQPALDMGAVWLKYFVYSKPAVLVERFKRRFDADVLKALDSDIAAAAYGDKYGTGDKVVSTVKTYTDRLIHLLGPEATWFEAKQWDGILYGDKHPIENLKIIDADIRYKLENND
jgi:guanylate kinase